LKIHKDQPDAWEHANALQLFGGPQDVSVADVAVH
jgi:hypothetical protein